MCTTNLFTKEREPWVYRVLWFSDNGGFPAALVFRGAISSPVASFVPGPVLWQRFLGWILDATLYLS